MCAAYNAALPGRALAYEDRVTVGLGVGYAGAFGDNAIGSSGVLTEATVNWGFDDRWSLQGHLSYGLHPKDKLAHVGLLGGELVYALDVVRFVPFVGVGLGGLVVGRDGARDFDLAVNALLGVDYWINRRWILGVDVRGYWLPFDLSDFDPAYLTATLRVSFVLDVGR